MSKFDFNKFTEEGSFDKHINLSIPNYSWLIEEVKQYAKYFIDEGTNVIDIGCSSGRFLKEILTPKAKFYGIDNSTLLPASEGNLSFINADLTGYTNYQGASFITSIFTLQFLPRRSAEEIIERINRGLNQGGAFILCEKVYSSSAMLQDIITSKYYEYKEKSFTDSEILTKERELRESLKLRTVEELMALLAPIGKPELFWRSYNFVGIIVIKEGK